MGCDREKQPQVVENLNYFTLLFQGYHWLNAASPCFILAPADPSVEGFLLICILSLSPLCVVSHLACYSGAATPRTTDDLQSQNTCRLLCRPVHMIQMICICLCRDLGSNLVSGRVWDFSVFPRSRPNVLTYDLHEYILLCVKEKCSIWLLIM